LTELQLGYVASLLRKPRGDRWSAPAPSSDSTENPRRHWIFS
jgi:hypothetical protein